MVLADQSTMNWDDRGAQAPRIQGTGSMSRVVRSAGAVAMVIALVAGLAALAYARWMRPAADADAALAEGRYEEALARYADAEARFDRLAPARQFLGDEYGHVM